VEPQLMPAESEIFDYVIVGAGAAGCVLANRLAAGGTDTVCLLEAGPPDDSIFLRIPAGVYKASSSPKYAWQFETEPHSAFDCDQRDEL
jgi:choline dehydrogenase